MNTPSLRAFFALTFCGVAAAAEDSLDRWLALQEWTRDTDGPVVSLGAKGDFDDMHLLGPMAVREEGKFRFWFCGSSGKVADRVFSLELASGEDGTHFTKHAGTVAGKSQT